MAPDTPAHRHRASDPRRGTPAGGGTRYEPRTDGTVVGVGVDVVDIARLTDSLARTPGLLERLLTPSEHSLSHASRAARVAAKEAVGKALGHPGDFSWHDVTVERTAESRPYLVLRGATERCAHELGVSHLHLSLSHDGPVATAIVVAERGAAGSSLTTAPGGTA
ncbi:holo-ACP synthase [Brachybacterium sp. AOP25-B2-12]|uniref:holo-ACP synthase n=1 Tax=Brachybacterium sp. AOP25-B2-12 TaxID=3457710 RepID=UPI0040340689